LTSKLTLPIQSTPQIYLPIMVRDRKVLAIKFMSV
jgi:hypothetical protein